MFSGRHFAQTVSSVSVAQILHQSGFESATSSSIAVLSDVIEAYFTLLARKLGVAAEMNNRQEHSVNICVEVLLTCVI